MSNTVLPSHELELPPGVRRHTGNALTITADNYPNEFKAFQVLLKELKTMHLGTTTKEIGSIDGKELISIANEMLQEIIPTKWTDNWDKRMCKQDKHGFIILDRSTILSLMEYPVFDIRFMTKLWQIEYVINTFNECINQQQKTKQLYKSQEELLKLKVEKDKKRK